MDTVKKRLLLLLSAVAIIFVIGIVAWQFQEQHHISLLYQQESSETNRIADKLVVLHGEKLANLTSDYTNWDEMVAFVKTRDLKWAKINLVTGMGTYGANALAVYTPGGVQVYSVASSAEKASLLLPAFEPAQIKHLFSTSPLCHFFLQTRRGLVEVRGAIIVPSADAQRTGPIRGYFLAAQIWDASYLEGIASLIDGKATLLSISYSQQRTVGEKNQSMIVYRNRLYGADGSSLKTLCITKPFREGDIQRAASRMTIVLLCSFVLLMMLVLFIGTTQFVTRPLGIIAHAIESRSPDTLSHIERDPSEFGRLASLIRKFFQQQDTLEEETRVRARTEEALQALASRQEAILSAIPDIIMEVDCNKIYTWANPAGIEFFGEDVIGKEAASYFTDTQDIFHDVQPLFDGDEHLIYVENWQRRKDGKERLLAWWCRVLKDIQGTVTGALSTAHDITERKEAEKEKDKIEAQLRQVQKIESVGRLAGGVAHDFNNMLGVILGNTELALAKLDPSETLFTDLTEIKQAAERSANLTRQLLAFARQQTVVPKVLDMNAAVAGILNMLHRLIGEAIELRWQPNKELWLVKMDPSQIDQILANLCINARDAIAGVGTLSITLHNSVLDMDFCATHAGCIPGEYVLLSVTDDGCGMDTETLDKVFEPFFTTKEMGKGTGLGLATVYGIVKQNNGFIYILSETGVGTTFHIYLPRCIGNAESNAQDDLSPLPVQGIETILIVEDEPAILELVKRVLAQQGYQVITANSPAEAISLAKEYPGEIHLLLTDVVMPEMNGRELAQRLLVLFPKMKLLFMSGYTADVIAHHGELDEGLHFLQKPFTMQDLTGKVREMLDE